MSASRLARSSSRSCSNSHTRPARICARHMSVREQLVSWSVSWVQTRNNCQEGLKSMGAAPTCWPSCSPRKQPETAQKPPGHSNRFRDERRNRHRNRPPRTAPAPRPAPAPGPTCPRAPPPSLLPARTRPQQPVSVVMMQVIVVLQPDQSHVDMKP